MIPNYILRYKSSVHLCAFFGTSVVKFYHREHGDENTKGTETNTIWFPFDKIDF